MFIYRHVAHQKRLDAAMLTSATVLPPQGLIAPSELPAAVRRVPTIPTSTIQFTNVPVAAISIGTVQSQNVSDQERH